MQPQQPPEGPRPSEPAQPIVVFDGLCNLCSRSVRFILDHDRSKRFLFTPLQSPIGRELMQQHGIDPQDAETVLLIDNGKAYTRSDAMLEIARHLGAWRWLGVAGVLPRGARDWVYRIVARNRYRWFGTRSACFAPRAADRSRFLE